MNQRTDLERAEFEKRLLEDPYDFATHQIFADWLQDQGLDDEAQEQYLWSEEWQKAVDWVKQFAVDCGMGYEGSYDIPLEGSNEVYAPFSYEQIMTAADTYVREYSKNSDWVAAPIVQIGSDSARNLMGDRNVRRRFWDCWSIIRRRPLEGDIAREGRLFSCTC